MSFISDLVNGKEIQVSNGQSYTIQAKDGAEVLIMSASGELVLNVNDVNKLQRALSIMKTSKDLEK